MFKIEFDKFEYNSAGYKSVLRSEGVQSHLESRAQEIANRAKEMYDESDSILEVKADSYRGKNRAGASAIAIGAGAERAEAERRILGRALDGG